MTGATSTAETAPTGRTDAPRPWWVRAAPFLPAGIVVAAWIWWGHADGGYFARTWYPCAHAALALLVVLAIGGRRVLPASRHVRLALGLLGGLVAWTYLSLLWSDAPATGLEAANELLLTLLVAWIMAVLPWTTRSASVLLGVWVAGVTGVCAISLLSAYGTDRIGDFFIEGRYLDPLGYSNAVSALPAMALWPALILVCRRTTPLALRPLLLGACVLLLEFSLLPQSRGAIIGLVVTAPLFVLLAPERLRLLPVALVVGGATLLAVGPMYHVYDVATALTEGTGHQPVGPAMDDAVRTIAWTVLAAVAAGVVLALLDRSVRPSAAAARGTRRGLTAALWVVAAVAVLVALVNLGDIRHAATDAWDTFKSGKDTPAVQGARIATAYADQRYDYWTVALEAFEDRPLAGIGAGGYDDRYTRDRAHEKPSRYVHDLWLRILAEGGLIGELLLLGFIAVALGGAAWLRRRLATGPAAVVAACVAASAYFFVHSSFDWIEEFPALLSPATALPLVALVVAAPVRAVRGPRARGVRLVAGLVGAVGVAFCLLALVPAYLSTRYLERGTRTWSADPQAAFRDLDRAADLSPWSAEPELRAGTLALDLGRLEDARGSFEDSLTRHETWYARLELGLIASQRHQPVEALRQVRRAYVLNSRDLFVTDAVRRLRKRELIRPARFNEGFQRLARDRFTRPRN